MAGRGYKTEAERDDAEVEDQLERVLDDPEQLAVAQDVRVVAETDPSGGTDSVPFIQRVLECQDERPEDDIQREEEIDLAQQSPNEQRDRGQ